MELCGLCHHFISIKRPPNLQNRPSARLVTALSISSLDSHRAKVSESLQNETLKILEWGSVCQQLSAFTSTAMGFSVARNGNVPLGRSRDESQKLLDQTKAASLLPRPLDFSGIEDLYGIVNSSVSGEMITVGDICAVRRTLKAARALLEQLEEIPLVEGSSDRHSPLLEILQNCNFQMELEQKIGFCIDCNLSVILDKASEELGIIRSERKRNTKNLDALLKRVSTQIFQAGAIDKPLVTKRRSRMCVGIRASHRNLLRDGVLLNSSSSGTTYFMEPKEAVELNNKEVKLLNSEKAEEMAILSLLTSKIAESEIEIKYLLDKILEVDLAFARAIYARWMNGVCPILEGCESLNSNVSAVSFSVDVEGIQHPLLLESSLSNLPDAPTSNSGRLIQLDMENGVMNSGRLSGGPSVHSVPIDIKIGCGTKVVVISGPNTGGKTASMKTLGLASLMSKAGMYLPAKDHPKIPWFDLILADIGDCQSLEQNLSTFSGHISRICKILEVASKDSLVLIDEIGSGTDPSEGVALSASILQYLKSRVNLAVVTTHYAELSRLKENDTRFENAAMEFSLETLQPTYRVLWGSTGDSNALSIAKSLGFDNKVIDQAEKWVERLMPEKQQERQGFLYQSLKEERNTLETQARRAVSLHSEVMDLYNEIQREANDLDRRMTVLKAKETQQIQRELKAAKSQIEAVVHEFENQLKTATSDQFNSLIRKSEYAIASIVDAHQPSDSHLVTGTGESPYTPKSGEQVLVKGLGDKFATVIEAPRDDDDDDENVLVQYGKIKVHVKKSNIRAIPSSERSTVTISSVPRSRKQGGQSKNLGNLSEVVSYGPLVQTSKNSVDLRGMRVEEASDQLDIAISTSGSHSVLFVIHGMGTGVVKERVLEILKNHPRVVRFEQESPMNYGCTVAYIK